MVRFEVGTKLLETQLAMGSFMLILTYQKLLNDEQIPETTTKESS